VIDLVILKGMKMLQLAVYNLVYLEKEIVILLLEITYIVQRTIDPKPMENVHSPSCLAGIFPFEIGDNKIDEFLSTRPSMMSCHADELTGFLVRTVCLDVLKSDID
jgi:hypothetical protein